jgi:hypothetical protein
MNTAAAVITGTVAGFVLVIDPDNNKGLYERVEFSDATVMEAHSRQIERADNARNQDINHYATGQIFFTVYRRDDNGEMEPSEGADLSGKTSVGASGYKKFCRDCNTPMWFSGLPSIGSYRCSDCIESDDVSDMDFTNYDGMQEREY